MAAKRDYYEVLGVTKTSSDYEVKQQYRKLALKFHPDRNQYSDAEEHFKEISEAYAVISNPEKKQAYDQYGHAGVNGRYSNADIFQYDGVIYKTNIDWVEELHLTKDVQIGEIKTKNDANTDFKDEMSNKLPIGAKIFFTKEREDILIVESEGEIKKYLAIVEG